MRWRVSGLKVTYLGSLGYPTIHPVFNEFATRVEVHSIADACHTDAVEFVDAKLMLGKMTPAEGHYLGQHQGAFWR